MALCGFSLVAKPGQVLRSLLVLTPMCLQRSADLLGKLSKAVKTKSVSVMDRLSGYVKSVPAVDRSVFISCT